MFSFLIYTAVGVCCYCSMFDLLQTLFAISTSTSRIIQIGQFVLEASGGIVGFIVGITACATVEKALRTVLNKERRVEDAGRESARLPCNGGGDDK